MDWRCLHGTSVRREALTQDSEQVSLKQGDVERNESLDAKLSDEGQLKVWNKDWRTVANIKLWCVMLLV